jgi:hypothetical protein
VRHIGLTVFGTNQSAIGRYVGLGYDVISQQMIKPLMD